MYTIDTVRLQLEPTYRLLFLDWLLADSMEMPAYLSHLGKALDSIGVDLDLLHANILEGYNNA